MNQQQAGPTTRASEQALVQSIARLAAEASIEITVQDIPQLEASRALLATGKKVYVSYLPKQSWQESITACEQVRAAGFEPVPHIPVRLVPDEATLERTLSALLKASRVEEVLLISGDFNHALGPYSNVAQVLSSEPFRNSGLARVSLAGHPEGHPKVSLDEIRRAERDKVKLAATAGFGASLITQFFFEIGPFMDWQQQLRKQGVGACVVAGVAGPARLSTLLKFALRCGIGPSLRALGTRPNAMLKLMGEQGPENLLFSLAQARLRDEAQFARIHLFCFGGYLRTCQWLHAVAAGQFKLTETGFALTEVAQG